MRHQLSLPQDGQVSHFFSKVCGLMKSIHGVMRKLCSQSGHTYIELRACQRTSRTSEITATQTTARATQERSTATSTSAITSDITKPARINCSFDNLMLYPLLGFILLQINGGRGGNRTHRGQDLCPPHGFEGRDRHQTTSASVLNICTSNSLRNR